MVKEVIFFLFYWVDRCKRLNKLGMNPLVLLRVSAKALAIRAKNWSESAHKFLKQCADAGNLEACYILGMVGHFPSFLLKKGVIFRRIRG